MIPDRLPGPFQRPRHRPNSPESSQPGGPKKPQPVNRGEEDHTVEQGVCIAGEGNAVGAEEADDVGRVGVGEEDGGESEDEEAEPLVVGAPESSEACRDVGRG